MNQPYSLRYSRLFLLIGVIGFCSCHDTYTLCEQSRVVSINGRFLKYNPLVPPTAFPPSILSVTGIVGNPLLTNVASPSIFSLSLTPGSDSAKFVLLLNGNLPKDTITCFYTTQLTTISANCGSVNTYNLTSVKSTHNTIDSVAIVDPVVDTRLANNLQYFY